MKRFGLTNKQISFIKNTIEFGLQSNQKAEISVFGSRATGKHKRYSDVDLLISAQPAVTLIQIERIKESFEDSEFPLKVDLVSELTLNKAYKKNIETQKVALETPRKHPWRLCPPGEYWRSNHSQSTHTKRNGVVYRKHPVSGSCCKRPSGKDQYYPDEIHNIFERNSSKIKILPCSSQIGFLNGSKFDKPIALWTQHWNDIFQSSDPVPVNLVKALIASESKFNPTILASKKNLKSARGLAQITDDTRKILSNESGELRDHYFTITRDELNDPEVNICAGIRWLFHKKNLASNNLGRPATWDEAVINYKGLAKDMYGDNKQKKARAQELIGRFRKYLTMLDQCKKQ